MKLLNLTEGRGQEVVSFSDAVNEMDDEADEELKTLIQKMGSILFKAGFRYIESDAGDFEFTLTTDNGCIITASIAYKYQRKWVLHLVGQEKDVMIEWDGTPLDKAIKLQGSQIIKVVDDVFKSLDEADLTLGVKHKFVRK